MFSYFNFQLNERRILFTWMINLSKLKKQINTTNLRKKRRRETWLRRETKGGEQQSRADLIPNHHNLHHYSSSTIAFPKNIVVEQKNSSKPSKKVKMELIELGRNTDESDSAVVNLEASESTFHWERKENLWNRSLLSLFFLSVK